MKDLDVPLSLDHEVFIIRAMRKAAARVDAEKKYYDELEAHHVTCENNAGPVCSPPDPEYHLAKDPNNPHDTRTIPTKNYDQAMREYQACQSDWEGRQESVQVKLADYLGCVQKYVDSNAIEGKCPHFQ